MGRIEYPLLPPLEEEIMPSGKCPFCKRDTIFVDYQFSQSNESRKRYLGTRKGAIALSQCSHKDCGGVVYREFNPSNTEEQWDIYPSVELEAEEELRDPVKRSYQEALNVFSNGHWTSAVQALGRTLHDATAQLRPSSFTQEQWLAKKSFNRIEELGKTGMLPESMKQWLHEIRESRVWATHGDEYKHWWANESDANEALEFTKWFLRFAFILPEQLQKRKARLYQIGPLVGRS